MPAIAPIALEVGETTETYLPTSSNGNRTQFTDNSTGRLANWRVIRFDVRPAGAGNSGHLVEALLVRPIPVEDQAGCCVDKDAAPASTIRIQTLLHKAASPAQAIELVESLVALASDAGYQAVIKGGNYY